MNYLREHGKDPIPFVHLPAVALTPLNIFERTMWLSVVRNFHRAAAAAGTRVTYYPVPASVSWPADRVLALEPDPV